MILEDRKVKSMVIADTLKISKVRDGPITREYMGMRKLCAKWVPRELTDDQKQQRVGDSGSVWSCSIVKNLSFCVDMR